MHRPRGRDVRGGRAQRGFTYLVVLFLVGVMTLGLTITTQVWLTAHQQDKEEDLLYVGDQYRQALQRYYSAKAGYPGQLEDLLKDPRMPGVQRYLRRLYRDPITGSAEWGLVQLPGVGIVGVHSLSEREPLKKANFGFNDQAFEGKTKYSEWVFATRVVSSRPPAGAAQPQAAPVRPAGGAASVLRPLSPGR